MQIRYQVYDVFTQTPFGGNPLAVIPDAASLPEDALQKIAREFNFSETTFVYPPQSAAHTAKVRIFTPTMEIPFAGHPTIGTAVALAEAGAPAALTLELGVGPIACNVHGSSADFLTTVALETGAEPDPALVADALGITTQDMDFTHHPPSFASLGLPFVFTQLKSKETLARVTSNVDAFRRGRDAYPSTLDFAQFVYVRDIPQADHPKPQRIDARMFAPLDNIPEDPATGSACAALGAFLAKIESRDVALAITQGVDMGRPSQITIQATQQGVTVAGHAIKMMEGVFTFPI